MSPTQRQFKFGIFCAIVALLSTLYPIRNATDQFNTLELKADTNEGAVGSSTASQQSTITAGALHTCALLSTGAVKCWGHNGSGQLGDGTTSGKISPTQVSGLTSGVAAIAAGYSHTCALLTSGSVKCWGGNNRGQLGDLTYDSRTAPVTVSGLSDVSAIAAGDAFTCALLTTGTVKCWGFGNSGQLGNGGSAEQRAPIDVPGLSGVTAIAAGQVHACALLSTGTVKCWGDRRYGQVGDGTSGPLSPRSPIDVLASGTAASNPVPLTDVTAISAGARSTCALLSSGAVMCWGANADGQLGDGTTTTRLNPIQVLGLTSGVTAISTSDHDFGGEAHTCALLSTGAVKCWGANQYAYQIGDGTNVSKSIPTQVSGLSSGVTAVTTGAMHSCALISGGTVKCWGYNANNQLGNAGGNANTPTEVAGLSGVGPDTSAPTWSAAAVNSAGTQLILQYSESLASTTAATANFSVNVDSSARSVSSVTSAGSTVVLTLASAVTMGQTVTVAYTDPTGGNDANAVQDSAGNDAASLSATSAANHAIGSQNLISVGMSHSCAITPGGGVKCWGSASSGRLGNGQTTGNFTSPVDVNNLTNAVAIDLGSAHSCALTSDGGVKCWGSNFFGENGTGQTRTTPTDVTGLTSGVAAISAGGYVTCALMTNSGVKCWGKNSNGQLGDGTTTDRSTPVDVVTSSTDSSPLRGVTAISAAFAFSDDTSHSCALMVNGGVKCWGFNTFGALGDGTTTSKSAPVNVVTSGTDQSQNLLSGITAISDGKHMTCAVTNSGTAKCWGVSWPNTNSTTLGNGTEPTEAVSNGSGHKLGSKWPVDVLASGTPSSSPVTLTGVSAVSVGYHHTCARMSSGGVKCWGNGWNGDGAIAYRTTPVNVLTAGTNPNQNVLSEATAVSVGEYLTCVLFGTGAIQCWGQNGSGSVGDGTTTERLNPVSVAGGFTFGSDATVPTFVSAVTSSDGTTITLTYSEALSATTASVSAFAVVVGGSSRGVSGAVVSGSTVVLTLASAVGTGQSVTVAYSDPSGSNDANAVQDSAGNDAATLSATSVTNNADSVSPSYVSAATSAAGTEVTLTFGEALSATTAAAGAFSVVVNGSAVTPSSVTVSGSTVVLAVTPAIQRGDTVTFSYTDPTAGNDANAVQDSVGNDVASISATSVTNSSTVDTRAPTFVSAVTSTDGLTVTLTYSEALSVTTSSTSAFAVLVGGAARSVSSAAVSGSTVVLTLASAVGSGQSVTVAYSDPTAGNDANAVQDSAGNDAATLSATSVTNNVPQPSSGGTAPTNGTTTSTSSTSTTTTIASGPSVGTTTSTAPRRPRSTTTTVANRTTTTIRATTTTTSNVVSSPTTLSARVSSTSTASSSSTTTSSTTTTTTTTVASASITSVAFSAIESLQQAEEKLKAVEAQTNAVTNDLRAAQIQVGESRVAVLDPKSALVVAVNVAEGKVARLSAANASTAEIAAAVSQLENLKIAIAQNVAISIEKIAQAQSRLATVLANPSATAVEVAEAKAELVAARIPDVSVVVSVLESAQLNTHLTPIVIPGVVDNPGSGEVVLFNGSTESQVEIVRINGSAIQMKSTDGFTLKISTRDSNGQPIQFNSRGGIVVKHGNFISISGEGFAPGTVAKTWLFSSPRELGNLNVNSDGSFAAEFPITDDIHVGDHIAQVNGLSPDGQVRSLSLDVEILPNQGPAPYDPIANRLAIAALFAQAMALLALSRGKDNDDDERGQADVSEVAIDRVDGLNMGKPDVYSPPVIGLLDQFLRNIPSQIATTQRLIARVVQDGIYLRALTGIGGVAVAFSGVIVGFFAANSAGFEAMSPSFGWLLALVIVGSIDALAGGMAALTIITTTAISGGIDSTDSIRGLLGIAVLSFAIPLVASTTRPFRRASTNSGDWLWTRMSDVVLLSLFGAWAAGAMYDALPGLYGFTSSAAGRTTTVQVVALATLIMRFILEAVATKVTGNRLAYLAEPSLSEPSASRTAFAILVRTAIMVFVAEAFIGNNIALWVGAAMYALPKMIALIAHRFPKSEMLKLWLPAGLLRTVVMLFVARWWASNISTFSEDPATQLQLAFVLLGIPSLVLTSLGWFSGSENRWHSTPFSKLLGVAILVIGVLTVRGVLFA